jgi:SNF2 family DNA or RNA helicase
MCGYGNHIPVFKKHMINDFLQKMHSIAFRVTKSECLDLPQITEEIRTVELEPKAMKLYKQLEKESFAELAGSEVSAVNVLTKMLRLSQMTGGHLTDDEGDTNAVSTAKLDTLSDILDTTLAEDKKLVIMARFIPELNDIQKLLKKKNIGYASVRGGISDRAEEIRRFQEDADCRVFVGQIAAAGLGIRTCSHRICAWIFEHNFDEGKAKKRKHTVVW